MTKFSNKLKKPCFGPIFGPFSNFGAKKNFPENPALSHTTSYEFLAPCQIIKQYPKHPSRCRSSFLVTKTY